MLNLPAQVPATYVTVRAYLNPEGAGPQAGTYEFLYRRGDTGCAGEGKAPEPPAPKPGLGIVESREEVSQLLSGLSPGTEYTVCVLVENEAKETKLSTPLTFTTAETIEETYVSSISSTGAKLNAKIDPEGTNTAYTFEYRAGGEGEYTPVKGGSGDIGEGATSVAVEAELEGLAAETTYEYRVSITKAGKTLVGLTRTFTTQGAVASPVLPDGRQWEMVSPPNKHGGGIEGFTYAGGDLQAAENGDALAYYANGPIVGEPEGNLAVEKAEILSKRESPGVWSTQDLVTPHENTGVIPIGIGYEYKLFSPDLSDALVEPEGETTLPPASKNATQEHTLYLRNNPTNAYQPLVSEANALPGVPLGDTFEGASPNLEHVVFAKAGGFGNGLYEWNGTPGQQGIVQTVPGPKTGGLGDDSSTKPVSRNAVSSDGSRVVWTEGSENLYLTDPAAEETVLVATNGYNGAPHFMDANSDGTKIFFDDGTPLVAGADSGSGKGQQGDLYVFEAPRGKPLSDGFLRDLTIDSHMVGGVREEGGMKSYVIGVGSEGSGERELLNVYFVDSGVLGDGVSLTGASAKSHGYNLYVERYAKEAWEEPQLVASLTFADGYSWGENVFAFEVSDSPGVLTEMTSGVSTSGKYLAFMSSSTLTEFDNRDVVSGQRDQEVFVYDADTRRLACASCNAYGVRPRGAASVPGWTGNIWAEDAQFDSRFMSGSGRLFFDSSDALVPGDINGLDDVYEYEPEGVGSCSPSVHSQDMVFRVQDGVGGCVGLISSGTSSQESTFMEASGKGPGGEEGEDVFFLTTSQLVSKDIDSADDVYDAHECSSAAPCASNVASVPPACEDTDSCRVAPAAQPSIFGAPSSATFSGNGGPAAGGPAAVVKTKGLTRAQQLTRALKACKRGQKHRRRACEAHARDKYGSARKSTIAGRRSK